MNFQENEHTLVHLYQTLPSQRDVIYNVFERQYMGMLIKYSYRNEDNLQACKLGLHLALMTFSFELPFIFWLKRHCQHEVNRCLRDMKGYDVYRYKRNNIEPILVSIDAPLMNRLFPGQSYVDVVGPDSMPNAEQIIEEQEQISENLEFLKSSPHYQMMVDYLSVPKQTYKKGQSKDYSVYNAFCDKYEATANIKKKTAFKNKRWTIFLKLRNIIRAEIDHLRKIKGLPPLGRKAIEGNVSQYHKTEWYKEWYARNKERQSLYYKDYNARKRKK